MMTFGGLDSTTRYLTETWVYSYQNAAAGERYVVRIDGCLQNISDALLPGSYVV